MSTQSSDLSAPEQMAKLLRLAVISALVAFVSTMTSCVGVYMAFSKKPVAIAATDQGRVIPLVPLDKPYVTDSRVLSFVEECGRKSFSHDFKNFRMTLNEASKCFTTDGSKIYLEAMDEMIRKLEAQRMIMSISMEPPVVVKGPLMLDGRATWYVQSKITLFREGQSERLSPQSYILDTTVVRVDLEENVRGIAINEFFVGPAK
jgi:intracellular multiplication protein IcmL